MRRTIDCVAADLQAGALPNESSANIALTQDRYASSLIATVMKHMPQLVMLAALEEVTAQYLRSRSEQTVVGASAVSAPSAHPPLYYSKPPNTYLVPPQGTGSSKRTPPKVQFTPSMIVSRIKQGCLLVHGAVAVQPQVRRSSSRLGATSTEEVTDRETLWKIVPGGKVAQYLYQHLVLRQPEEPVPSNETITSADTSLENDVGGKSDVIEPMLSENNNGSSTHDTPRESNGSEQQLKDADGDAQMSGTQSKTGDSSYPNYKESDDEAEDEQAETAEEDSYMPDAEEETNADDDDDDDVEGYVKEKLSVLKTELVEEENPAPELEDDEDDEDFDALTGNPYLKPTMDDLIDWIGRKTSRYLTNADLQPAFTDLVWFQPKKKRRKQGPNIGISASILVSPLDRLVWQNTMPSILGSRSRLVLQSVIDEEPPQVMKWETQYFARSNFTIMIRNDALVEDSDNDEATAAVTAYRERRTWDTQRYTGIHNGYTIWPSWMNAAREWHAKTFASTDETMNAVMPEPNNDVGADDDLAVAQALAEQDGRGSRRTTRRGGEKSGVFYGNQSNMSQKQLLDAILRFTSQNVVQTASSLLASIPEESTDPLRRLRTALGRVLWKRNQIAKLGVSTEWTDGPLFDRTLSGPLIFFPPAEGPERRSDDSITAAQDAELIEYIRFLHQVELGLRSLVMGHLTELPTAIVAAAADERHGSMEALDSSEFENLASLEWQTEGHEFISKRIFRPTVLSETNGLPQCYWYTIRGFIPSIATDAEDAVVTEKSSIGRAKECVSVERRMRFKAVIDEESKEDVETGHSLALTESQVLAGLKAAKIEQKNSGPSPSQNSFAREVGSKITLLSSGTLTCPSFAAIIAGHNSARTQNGVVNSLLLLPESDAPVKDAFWTSLNESDETSALTCAVPDMGVTYTVQQSDYEEDSAAFQECRAILTYLRRHPKAGAFLEPVDPVALNVPNYFDVVKNPMDVSTVAKKLENGKYSNFPASQTSGRTPEARMLNGPFRRDIELIFDNAMLFNPPDDWIHQAAITTKRAVLKKIEQASQRASGSSDVYTRKRSLYVDYDSDVDNYVYESDHDDEYTAERRGRKRKTGSRSTNKDELSFRAIEGVVRMQKSISESLGLRGPFADFPINTNAQTYSLPKQWSCRRGVGQDDPQEPDLSSAEVDEELDHLVALHKQSEVTEAANVRRSTRATTHDTGPSSTLMAIDPTEVEYTCKLVDESTSGAIRSRVDVELFLEKRHEEVYARQYYNRRSELASASDQESTTGVFSKEAFPPYLGRLLPTGARSGDANLTWEIREPFIVPALRWVIRGLIHSEHLTEVEPLVAETMYSGAVIANNVYYLDPSLQPCEVLNLKEIQRRKRADQDAQEESEDEVELSEYEKLRAERVARNADRLKALGLA